MVKIGSILERCVVPVQISQPSVDRRVAMADVLLIALEEAIIADIEADDCDVQTDVCLGKLIAVQEG